MAAFLAAVLAAVHCRGTGFTTVERSSPVVTCLFFTSLAAHHVSGDLATVAFDVHLFLTSTAKSLVAGLRTGVLSTGHDIATDLLTAPTRLIVSLRTFPRAGFLSTETALPRSHVRTWRTRTGVA